MNVKRFLQILIISCLLPGPTLADGDFDLTLLEAQQGNAEAQSDLGVMYAKGVGTKQDNVSAFIWMSAAKANGDHAAARNLQSLRKQMSLQELVNGQAKAAKCIGSHYQHCK
ncbi:MAG: sel1 repeat family protein [Gammaproteobacteria bacterium]|nr:MAG: sel1 repeat family protein [Gammaproteobacteria bacterium]